MSQNPPVVKVPVCSTCRRRVCRVEALIADRHDLSLIGGLAYHIVDKACCAEIAACNSIARERKAADLVQFDLGYQRRLDAADRAREWARDGRE